MQAARVKQCEQVRCEQVQYEQVQYEQVRCEQVRCEQVYVANQDVSLVNDAELATLYTANALRTRLAKESGDVMYDLEDWICDSFRIGTDVTAIQAMPLLELRLFSTMRGERK